MILSLLRKDPAREAADALFAAAAQAARDPVYFVDWTVPDTPEGRFEVQTITVVLLLDRLGQDGAPTARLTRKVCEAMFAALDAALRELGVGDLSVGRRIRKLAEDFYGRASAYRSGLKDADPAALDAAVARNVFGLKNAPHAPAIARRMRDTARSLAQQPSSRLRSGIVDFPRELVTQ